MDAATTGYLREELTSRRMRLEEAVSRTPGAGRLMSLLEEVDSALKRMELGTYGLCEVCKDTIEHDRLVADPLLRFCIDHLTPQQRRALEEDLGIAAQIQKELLPKQGVAASGWETSYHYEAAGAVSGDYCDVIVPVQQNSDVLFLLGDVSGKGVGASILMSNLQATFHALAGGGLTVEQLVHRANRIFCESTLPSHFATLVCARGTKAGELEICNAGHCPVMLVRGGEVEEQEATSVPLGLFCDLPLETRRLSLSTGDTIVLYTDGLLEASSGNDEEYGTRRLRAVLERHAADAPREIIRACLADLAAFLKGARRKDDLTIMVIRRTA